jgi:hypothetical protein
MNMESTKIEEKVQEEAQGDNSDAQMTELDSPRGRSVKESPTKSTGEKFNNMSLQGYGEQSKKDTGRFTK